jgi:hypothetical protein
VTYNLFIELLLIFKDIGVRGSKLVVVEPTLIVPNAYNKK